MPIVGIILLLTPYTTSLLSSDSEKRLDIEIYESVMETIEDYSDENTFVLVDQSMMKYFYYPLLGKSNVSVYPFDSSQIKSICFDIKEKPSGVLYITDSIDNEVADRGINCFMSEKRTNLCNKEDTSIITGLPNAFHEIYEGDVRVVRFDSLYKLVDYSEVEEIEMNELNISVKDVEIDDQDMAHITVSFGEEPLMYHNVDGYELSYHVETNENKVWDNPRISLGELIVGDYSFDYNLTDINDSVTIAIDVVEEGVQWYSSSGGKVPAITFSSNGDEWNYSVDMTDLR